LGWQPLINQRHLYLSKGGSFRLCLLKDCLDRSRAVVERLGMQPDRLGTNLDRLW